MFSKMMFIDNKEEVGDQGQRLNEPNSGVPIKKRPFQLTPSSLEPCVPPFDKFPLTPKHFTPKSPLDLIIPLGFDPGNPSSDVDKPAGVVTNPLHDLNEIDMGRNYYPLKQSANPNLGMEMLQVGNAPKLHLSISGNMVKNKKFNQCSTDLSLTGPSTISSKTCFKPSHNLSNNKEKRSGFDLNLPTAETWDSAMNDFTSENIGTAQTEPVEALAKQGSVSGTIPHGVGSGLVPKGAGNNLKLPNTDKLSEKCSLSEVTLDLQLKLPPRPELRMKNLEIYSSDLSLSLSGKDLNCSPEPVNEKPRPVENSPKIKDKDITNPNVNPVAQTQVIVKQESRDVTLPEKVVQASGLKDQSLASGDITLPEKVVQASGLKDQSSASGGVVKKEPVDTNSHAQNPLGTQLDKSPCSGSESRQAKQAEISETNSLTEGIDLNSATPLPEVSTSGKLVNPVLAESVAVGQITQSAISQSDAHHNSKKIDNSLAPTPPLVGMEDIKPVITSSASPVVHDGKRMVSMASDGLSQGSADMDCSEEGQNLPKSATTGKTTKNTNCETNASSSSSVAINPKQEPGTIGEFDNLRIGGTPRGDNVKSLVPSSIPTKENQIQIPMPAETSITQNNENDTPSSSTKLSDLPNKDMQGLCLDMEAGGSKSRSPSTSISREREEVDPSSERENGTSSRQTEGNNVWRRRFRNSDLGPDGAQFERRKSRMFPWDEGSNIHSNRGQRWEGQRFSQFDGDRFENGDNLNRRAFNMANRKRQTNSFNGRFGHNKYRGSRFTRTNSNTDMNFDEGNDGRKSRPHPRFQDRRRIADVSPRGADELDAPVFEHPSNHYKRVDHNTRRERNSSPGPRRGPHQWTPPGEMIGGHPDLLTRVDTRIRSPGRRPYFKKDNLNRRHASPPYNRARKPGRGGMHWNNGRQRYNAVGPHGPDADVPDLEAYNQLRCQGGEMMPFHARYPENDGAYSDGGGPHGRVRNYENAMSRPREAGEQDEYRYNNRGPHGWREGNPNNNGEKLKRRRY